MSTIFYIFIGYFMGAIPSALLVGKTRNIDIRQHGSGNIGGTNTFRVLGKKAGMIVTFFDILKGVVPTFLGLYFVNETTGLLAGIAASIGHSYSLFIKFRGGKSVATSTGVMLVISPISILFGVMVFAVVLFTTKYVSLSSMLASITVAISVLLVEQQVLIKVVAIFFALFIVTRHYTNIKRLIAGKESKAFQKK